MTESPDHPPSTPRPYDPEEPDTSAETPEAKKSQPPPVPPDNAAE